MDGVLNVFKPAGPTSHDIVAQVRRVFGQKRVGHAGTLDPMATGVLVVCLGKATRIVEYLVLGAKEYRARMVLGVTTDTQDSTGAVIEERDASSVTREALEGAARAFVGEIEQVPPMVSAVKHQGKRLYELARQGKTVERTPRRVSVYSIEVTDFEPGERAEAEMTVRCSSGTYIRTLCADMGERLGCGAHMSMLERTRVGRFAVDDAVTPEELAVAKDEGRLESVLCSIEDAVSDMPSVRVGAEDEAGVLHGSALRADAAGEEGDAVVMISPGGHLLGIGVIARSDGVTVVKPRKVLAEADG